MEKVKGTQTEKNLLAAFAGESQARNRYNYFASQAKKEGYEQISGVFAETANHEMAHAKRLFKFLEGGEVEVAASFPAGVIGSTEENLRHSAEGENHEHMEMYPRFAEVAEKEGFKEIAGVCRAIAVAEQQHEKRFLALLNNLKEGKVFSKGQTVKWMCRNCGYIHQGEGAPQECPACAHSRAFFELLAENF